MKYSSYYLNIFKLQTTWQYLGTVVNFPDFVNALIQPYKDEVITPQLPHNTYLNYVHGTQARWWPKTWAWEPVLQRLEVPHKSHFNCRNSSPRIPNGPSDRQPAAAPPLTSAELNWTQLRESPRCTRGVQGANRRGVLLVQPGRVRWSFVLSKSGRVIEKEYKFWSCELQRARWRPVPGKCGFMDRLDIIVFIWGGF